VNKIKLGEEDLITEMSESNVEKDISFTLKDIGDEETVKQLWKHESYTFNI
jgi:hypothetical protein